MKTEIKPVALSGRLSCPDCRFPYQTPAGWFRKGQKEKMLVQRLFFMKKGG
jgi:nitrate/TMAO reductase-like tetraheme cytochrome c subunit